MTGLALNKIVKIVVCLSLSCPRSACANSFKQPLSHPELTKKGTLKICATLQLDLQLNIFSMGNFAIDVLC
jgi:hypothetical protein